MNLMEFLTKSVLHCILHLSSVARGNRNCSWMSGSLCETAFADWIFLTWLPGENLGTFRKRSNHSLSTCLCYRFLRLQVFFIIRFDSVMGNWVLTGEGNIAFWVLVCAIFCPGVKSFWLVNCASDVSVLFVVMCDWL